MSVVGREKSKGMISHYLQSQLHFKSLEKGTTKDAERRAKAILRKNKAGGNHNSRLQDILQSSSNQNAMVLAQKQTHKSMDQKIQPRNKPMLIRTINL